MRTLVGASLITLVVSCGAFAQDTKPVPKLTYADWNLQQGQPRVIFKSGRVPSLPFDVADSETMPLSITMNGTVTYYVQESPASPEVVRGIYFIDTMNVVAPVINVKALAEEQVLEAKKQAAGVKRSPFIDFFEIQMVPFIAACFISLLGTTGIVYRLMKTSSSKMPETQKAERSVAINGANIDAILAQARIILENKTGAVPLHLADEDRPAERENTGLQHAKKFGRGQGEFRLAKTLESQNRQGMWEKRIQLLDPERAGGESVGTAKELGIGQGEVGLALSLRRLQDTETRKERPS